jgi:hypothetical protein
MLNVFAFFTASAPQFSLRPSLTFSLGDMIRGENTKKGDKDNSETAIRGLAYKLRRCTKIGKMHQGKISKENT